MKATRKGFQLNFGKLIDSVESGVLLLDESFNIVYRNASVEQFMGWKATAEPEFILDAVHQDDRFFVETTIKHIRETPDSSLTSTFRARKSDGDYVWLRCVFANRLHEEDLKVIVCNFTDVSARKEDHHLKLLESVVVNTTDPILITEAQHFDEPGPRILYVNEAFTRMTGYTSEEVLGKSPRFLQGPKTDQTELRRIGKCLRSWTPCETTVINYKKSGEEFWINFSLNPVADNTGKITHWISIDRDVTQQKNELLQRTLLSDVSQIFNERAELSVLLSKLLKRLVVFGEFELAEVWLVGADRNRINLAAKQLISAETHLFYPVDQPIKNLKKGEGLPGVVWQLGSVQCWDAGNGQEGFLRQQAATAAGVTKVYGVPLVSENETIGVMILGMARGKEPLAETIRLFDILSTHLGTDIRRKQLEQELNQVFNLAPDVICVVGSDGYFKKVNPALSLILGFTEEELLTIPLVKFIHPAERSKIMKDLDVFNKGNESYYFEGRCISKAGQVKWLGWTSTPVTADGQIFTVAKDITEKKELEELLNKVSSLACIGGWEIDLIRDTLYWSKITKEIHEVPEDYEPDLENGLRFYKHEADRMFVASQVNAAINDGVKFDYELEIISAKQNAKWIRVIGEPEFKGGTCTRIYGSFQDVSIRRQAEIAAKYALEDRNVILESIGDAFFAVDKNWVVTYWNNMAEKVLSRTKADILGHVLWNVFADSVGSASFENYHRAVRLKKAVHFEDYYPPLEKWYEISAYPSENGLSVYFKDSTERKLSEMLLTASEKRYSELFQLSPLPKWVFDLSTFRFLDVNHAAITHYGYSREEFLGMTLRDIFPLSEHEAMEKSLIKYQRYEKSVIREVTRHQKKDGHQIHVDIQSNYIEYQGRNARIAIASDITERLNYIAAIEAQNKKLKEISWLQSHVVRAPLARILGLIPLISNSEETAEEKSEMLQLMLMSAKDLDRVIIDITNKTEIIDPEKEAGTD
ncbi:MAG: PAS domain S-box protein [Bacteroidota bacterium]